jgi:hypothetical protein
MSLNFAIFKLTAQIIGEKAKGKNKKGFRRESKIDDIVMKY